MKWFHPAWLMAALLLCLGQPAAAQPLPAGSAKAATKTVGVLIYPQFEALDAYGPIEMWGNLNAAPAELWGGEEHRINFRVVTIAAEPGPVPTYQGPATMAQYGYADAPHVDYLVVPGGVGADALMRDETALAWLRATEKKADMVTGVCNGATILARAGILDDLRATTNKMYWEQCAVGDTVHWVKDARWVDEGRIVTSSGISAGIDMTLAVISKLYGERMGQWDARYAEYVANTDPHVDPFAVQR